MCPVKQKQHGEPRTIRAILCHGGCSIRHGQHPCFGGVAVIGHKWSTVRGLCRETSKFCDVALRRGRNLEFLCCKSRSRKSKVSRRYFDAEAPPCSSGTPGFRLTIKALASASGPTSCRLQADLQEKVARTSGTGQVWSGCSTSVRSDDVVIMSLLDRLARSTRDLLDIAEQLKAADAGLRSLHEPWADTTSPAGRMVLTVFAGIGEFERELIHERTSVGRTAAKSRGVRFGRPPKLTSDQVALAEHLTPGNLGTGGLKDSQSPPHHALQGFGDHMIYLGYDPGGANNGNGVAILDMSGTRASLPGGLC